MKGRSAIGLIAIVLLSVPALARQPDATAAGILSSSSSCVPAATSLCLNANRFRVEVVWRVPSQGTSGAGNAVPLTDDAGYFWFFSGNNVELVIKILGQTNYFSVFYGALSNVEYTITATDTVTGVVKTYFNPDGKLSSVSDPGAFRGPSVETPPPSEESASESSPSPMSIAESKVSLASAVTACVANPTTLCLNGGRFQVQVAWRVPPQELWNPMRGATGTGKAVPLMDTTGYFWFFSEHNVELVIKILDGRVINDAWWVFVGALSNVEYVIAVTDVQTGAVRTYWNAPEQLASMADTEAFGKARPVWRHLAAGPHGNPVTALALDPLSGDLYASSGFASDGGGIFRLSIGGSNDWIPTSAPFSLGVDQIAIAPTEPPTIYAIATTLGPDPLKGIHITELFGSRDAGRTWTRFLSSISSVAVDPSRPTSVYAGGTPQWVYAIGVYKTENGGATWASSTGDFPCQALAVAPSDPAVIYAGTYGSVFKSVDAGATWSPVDNGHFIYAMAVDPVTSSLVYAGAALGTFPSPHGFLRSTDAGATWSFFPIPGYTFGPVVVDSFSRAVFVGGEGGVFRSDDEGEHWTPFNDGLTGLSITSLVLGPRQTLYAGTEDGVFAISTSSRVTSRRPSVPNVPNR